MTRKDSEKDAERPHYYSQFWLDIAAGRRVIGGPKPEDAETSEPEALESVSAVARKTGRNNSGIYDGYKEPHANNVVEPMVEDEEEQEDMEEEQEDTIDEIEMPNIAVEEEESFATQEAEPQEESFADEEPEDEDFYDEEDEEDDEDSWDRRGGRKKAKPTRPSKPVKKPKRDIRRPF